jgi:Type II CAAX prenyl endopeptidase Rce1-like
MLRAVTESVAILVVGAAAAQVCTPSKEYYESIEKFSAPILEQSQSLAVEFSEVMTRMETLLYGRLTIQTNRHIPLKGKSRKIDQKDLEEFCRNITNDETQSNESHERPPAMPDSPSHKVVPNFRLIPVADLERVTAVALRRALILKIQRSKEFKEEDLGTEAVVDVLDGIQEASQLVKSFSMRFEKQQQRLQRVINKGTAALLSPDDALYESRKRFLATALGYGVFCMSMDKFWPKKIPVPMVRPPLYAAMIMLPLGAIFHYSCTSFYLHNVHPFESSHLIVAEDKSIYSTYFNPSSLSENKSQSSVPKDREAFSKGLMVGIYRLLMREDDDDDDEEEDDDLNKPAEIPLVWHAGTLRDPFTLQRCSLHLIEKPILDEVLFRYVLLTRLVACGWGVGPAVIFSSCAYAAFVTGTCYDLRAMMCHLTTSEAFAMNFVSGISLSMMYLYGGGIGAPLLNAVISGYYMVSELSERGDIIKEKSAIWPVIQEYMKYDAAAYHATMKFLHMLKKVKSTVEKKFSKDKAVSESVGKSKEVLAIEELAAAVIEAYGTKESDREVPATIAAGSDKRSVESEVVNVTRGGSSTDVMKNREREKEIERAKVASAAKAPKEKEIVMTPDDIYDFLESALFAVTKIDRIQRLKREQGEMTDFLTVDYSAVPGGRQRHYSFVHALPQASDGLRREDYLKPYVYMLYPQGMTEIQFIDFISCHLSLLQLKPNPFEMEIWKNEILKWERQGAPQSPGEIGDEAAEGEEDADFLNLIDGVYRSVLYRLETDAVLFGVWRSSAFLDDLAGRRTTPEDMVSLKADLQEWMSYSYNRATADALVTYGLTPRRFNRLLRLYEEKEQLRRTPEQGPGPSVVLRWQWEDYLTGTVFKKRVLEIINPFGETERAKERGRGKAWFTRNS